MKAVIALVLLTVTCVVKAQTRYGSDLDQMDQDAIDALNEANYYFLDELISDLGKLVLQYRWKESNKVDLKQAKIDFVRGVRFLVYDLVFDRSTVEEFLYRIVSKWGTIPLPTPATKSAPLPEDKKAPWAETYPSDGRYPTPGFQSFRSKGDTSVITGMIGGEGGDFVNSVGSGIIQSGGGISDTISVVDGTNNLGVWRQ